jgi:hypothetical protein
MLCLLLGISLLVTLWPASAHTATVVATQEIRVNQSSDDAEESSPDTNDTSSSDLELVTEAAVQSVGMRFNGLSIQRGATVTNAYIQFQVDEATSDLTSLNIRGETTDNAPTFSAGINSVLARVLTTASVAWAPASWLTIGEASAAQRTPDISAVIEEITDRPGWEIGNSLVIVVNGTGVRIAESFDGDPAGAALLHVEYELTDQDAPVVDAGPDQDITLPADASLDGIVSDDGLPSPPATVTTLWTQLSGPGTASFASATNTTTTVSFSLPGTYVLRLSANDSEQVAYDDASIFVNPEPVPASISSFSPAAAQAGMIITLNGSHFSATDGVLFNGIPTNFWTDGDNVLHATVPPGNVSGFISVSNPWGSVSSVAAFVSISSPAVLVGAGDITNCRGAEEQVAQILDVTPGTVFTTGDNAYSAWANIFNNCYDPSWGRHKTRTRPAVGNADYATPGAAGYFNYFGANAGEPGKGYYSYDIANWHVVTLNSQCDEAGGCERDSAQGIWLRENLAKNPNVCTVAIWHHARYSSAHGPDARLIDIWKILYDSGVELVLNGHDHNYERFEFQDPYGNVDPNGIRQIIAGTGGIDLDPLGAIAPNSLVNNADTHGVLELTLNTGTYDWEFLPVAGGLFTDSGTGTCRLVNQPPVVIGGPDLAVYWPDAAQLNGRVLDDGYPTFPGSYLTDWSQVSGPGTANFFDGTQAETAVNFSELGRYVLRLSGDDGDLVSTDDIEVLVTEPGVQISNVQYRIAGSNNDVEEMVSNGVIDLISSDLEFIKDPRSLINDQLVGMRFTGVNVPPGADIWNAYIQFQVDEATVDPTTLSIAAEAADNSAGFTAATGNISARAVTTTTAAWLPAPWTEAGLAGIDQRTPDLSQVIQEVTDRPGWTSGNAMTLLVSGSGRRTAESYDGNAGAAPLLVIEYATGINTAPGVAIIDPADGTSVVEGALLSFTGTANDTEDGDLGAALAWESTIDGSLGVGTSINPTLSLGVHTITATSTDSGGLPGSAQITVTITEVPRVVNIDVLPGDAANVVFPNQSGNLPVAILSSADFNASTVDPDSLRFGLGEATRTGDVEISDVDGQFGNDTTVHFRIQDSGIFCDDTEVSVYGETLEGSPIAGTGSIDATQCETGGCHAY